MQNANLLTEAIVNKWNLVIILINRIIKLTNSKCLKSLSVTVKDYVNIAHH